MPKKISLKFTKKQVLAALSCAGVSQNPDGTVTCTWEQVNMLLEGAYNAGEKAGRAQASNTPENKPTDWRNVKEGTSVLFRRYRDSEYVAGTWEGAAIDGAFFWYVNCVSGYLVRDVGTRVADNGEWHIDPFWCKLA